MKKRWLISWVGQTDLRAFETNAADGVGPVANALQARPDYDRVHLFTNYDYARSHAYCEWLAHTSNFAGIDLHEISLSSPINYADIYEQVSRELLALSLPRNDLELTFHLSPGTPAMAAIWIILAKTRFPAGLIQTSKQNGLELVDFEFDLASDFLPEFLQRSNQRIERLATALKPQSPGFDRIIHQSQVMQDQISLANRIAIHDVPVLILGETGTGKELFAEAIHQASRRQGKPFVAVNCGAVPRELVNSELFGHKKGSFTGATSDRKGHFQEAEGGTLFLDEIGDLPLDAQVRLLRALQNHEITPVGETHPRKIDVRILAATHRDLMQDVIDGRFRQDLFHRLAVGILRLPPLRERAGDIGLLIDHHLQQINADSAHQPEWQYKEISVDAKNILQNHPWQGNVRELYHTILRAAIWSTQQEITATDIQNCLLHSPTKTSSVLDKPFVEGFDIKDILADVERHYVMRAMQQSGQKKTDAARLLGLKNYQTLSNRLAALGIDAEENND